MEADLPRGMRGERTDPAQSGLMTAISCGGRSRLRQLGLVDHGPIRRRCWSGILALERAAWARMTPFAFVAAMEGDGGEVLE
jgi:hypothetical protein